MMRISAERNETTAAFKSKSRRVSVMAGVKSLCNALRVLRANAWFTTVMCLFAFRGVATGAYLQPLPL
jgi:hypothetical protein